MIPNKIYTTIIPYRRQVWVRSDAFHNLRGDPTLVRASTVGIYLAPGEHAGMCVMVSGSVYSYVPLSHVVLTASPEASVDQLSSHVVPGNTCSVYQIEHARTLVWVLSGVWTTARYIGTLDFLDENAVLHFVERSDGHFGLYANSRVSFHLTPSSKSWKKLKKRWTCKEPPHAAGIYLQRDGLVWGVRSESKGTIGIPCGKIALGESPAQAAVRETYEETGLVCVVDHLTPPFVRTQDGQTVWVYRGLIAYRTGVGTSLTERSLGFVNREELESGPYKDFNSEMCEYFR